MDINTIKLKCTIPDLEQFNKKYDTNIPAELSTSDFHDIRYAPTVGAAIGIIDAGTKTVVKAMSSVISEDIMLQLLDAPEMIRHSFTQEDENGKIVPRILLCIPYRYEYSSLNRPDCNELPQHGTVTAEITLLEEFNIQRTFTLTIKNDNVPLMDLIHDVILELPSRNKIDKWKEQYGLVEDNSLLFSYMSANNRFDYEPGLTVDYFDDAGEPHIVTYRSSEEIWDHVQKIRVLDVKR